VAEEPGIWVRLIIDGNVEVTGYVARADSPNDFWVTFTTQLVHVEQARELLPNGQQFLHDGLYVNRDRILLASVLPGQPEL
jgi:hypothetical protein